MAADDLAQAKEIALSMAARYRMGDGNGYLRYDGDRTGFLGQASGGRHERRYSDAATDSIRMCDR